MASRGHGAYGPGSGAKASSRRLVASREWLMSLAGRAAGHCGGPGGCVCVGLGGLCVCGGGGCKPQVVRTGPVGGAGAALRDTRRGESCLNHTESRARAAMASGAGAAAPRRRTRARASFLAGSVGPRRCPAHVASVAPPHRRRVGACRVPAVTGARFFGRLLASRGAPAPLLPFGLRLVRPGFDPVWHLVCWPDRETTSRCAPPPPVLFGLDPVRLGPGRSTCGAPGPAWVAPTGGLTRGVTLRGSWRAPAAEPARLPTGRFRTERNRPGSRVL